MPTPRDKLIVALEEAGMPRIPTEFSVALVHQEIPRAMLAEIDTFVRVFERVTTRPSWQEGITASGPEITRPIRPEVCFFSAWDFHIPPEQPDRWQLIEFNDNGSGFLFAELINRAYYETHGLESNEAIESPPALSVFAQHLIDIVGAEAREFFGGIPRGLFLIVDDADSLRQGRFRPELSLLRDLFRRNGWTTEIACPEETSWDGHQLRWQQREVSFIINRSTDFLWQGEALSALRAAYLEGQVYVAPNPFTYATRSDKRLMEFLSLAHWDEKLGIRPEERNVLSARVPETYLLRQDNLDGIVGSKEDFVFKPAHGFAGHGLLASSEVGRSRIRRLLRKGQDYVAQRRVPKSVMAAPSGSLPLWTDLRLWAYRNDRFLISGRASRHPDRLDLTPPGGWIPTYVRV